MGKLTEKQVNDLLSDLAYHLDADVYFPTKAELTQPHSLGFRKENFKQYMEKRIRELML